MATNYNLNITRGSNFSVRLIAKDQLGSVIDLSPYQVKGIIKHRYSDSNALLDLKPSGVEGYLTSGFIDVTLSGAQTTGMPISQGVYDIEISSGHYVDKLIYGYVNFYPEVTN